ncbi:hypothetical protein CFHF_04095 [Caulobacter flavus]|uniref:IrrE N-terminal-like domain-containing protein n=1 Tax=Caulobacter flavus TaxID=1679497 RepID=A0A2N5CZE4_9CAUL|nr:ImmA/IrrE family metallo-endopeptidase [Caulobacter flavus]AYV45122.1 hypothetical protein C1707_02075 [Caulobacter flavus]PLR19198.1 hypothetical protein CFHF_04095 [Caulobacter flavus]
MALAARLKFDLQPHAEPERVTTRTLSILVDDFVVWPVRGEGDVRLEIHVDDLLAHLTDFWKPLMLRQVYPVDVTPLRPSDLRRAAERRWIDNTSATMEAEEEAITNFEEAHDLSHAFAGLYGLPSFWLLRAGDQFMVEAPGFMDRLPFAEVRAALTQVGDEICQILRVSDEARWEAAIKAWKDRDAGDAAALLAWSAGLDRGTAKSLIADGALTAPRNFEDAANDDDPIRIAARMAGALPPEQIRAILDLARQFKANGANALRELSEACLADLSENYLRALPFQQGEAAARLAREKLELGVDDPVPVFDIVTKLGVEWRTAPAEPHSLDGLAIWGPGHGPGVFLNSASRRILRRDERDVRQSPSARVTMAHELCHLLLDGGHALSAVEVLKARMPVGVEQRAKSFAGEFLLPTHVAGYHWHQAGRPRDRASLDELVSSLVEAFAVTRAVASWKVEHAAKAEDIDLTAILDSIAPGR